MTQQPTAKILFGEPQAQDAFPGRGHERTANALAQSINQIVDNGVQSGLHGGSIGLEGSWGSGKSSVIRMAEQLLPGQFDIVTFDMWEHQTDSFRRSLLEKMLNHVEANKPKWPDIDLLEEREVVQSRRRHVIDKTRKIYTPLGALLLLLLPLVAILFVWIQPGAFGNPKLGNYPFYALWIVGGVIVAAILMLISLIFSADTRLVSGRWKTVKAKFALGVSEFFTLSRDVNAQTTTQSIREEDPTTAEFQRIFQALLGKLQSAGRRLILVVDNADRLPGQQVKAAWSEMRSLFAERSADPLKSIVVIVPYDRNHIAAAFEIDLTGAKPSDNDIFDKTFDRVIAVAPPVPSDWRGYLDAQMAKAFVPPPTVGEREKLFRLFKLYLTIKKVRVTPRRILAYVNDIGAQRVQWGDAIPLEAMALYALHRHALHAADNVIHALNDIDPAFPAVIDLDDWRKYVAALMFNVEPVHANQVLFAPVIAAGLIGHDSVQLKSDAQTPGFWEVFQDVIEDSRADWIAAGPQTVSNVAANLVALELPEQIAQPAWRALAAAAGGLELKSGDEGSFAGLALVVANQQGSRRLALAERLRAKLELLASPVIDDEALGRSWARLVGAVSMALRAASAVEDDYQWLMTSRMAARGPFILGVADFCSTDSSLSFMSLELALGAEELSEVLLPLLDLDPERYTRLQPILAKAYSFDIAPHLSAIAVHLQNQSGDNSSLLRAAVQFTRFDRAAVQNHLLHLFRDGTLAWCYQNQRQLANVDGTSCAIVLSTVAQTAPVPTTRTLNANLAGVAEGVASYNALFKPTEPLPELEERVAELITIEQQFEVLFDTVIAAGADADFFERIMVAAVREPQSSPPIRQITANYPMLVDVLGSEQAARFVEQLQFVDGGPILEIAELEFSDIDPQFVASAGTSGWAGEVVSRIDEELARLDESGWVALLTNTTDPLMALFLVRQKSGASPIRGTAFVNAVSEVAAQVVSGTVDPSSIDGFTLIENALAAPSRGQAASLLQAKLAMLTSSETSAVNFVRFFPSIAGVLKFEPQHSYHILAHFVWFLLGSTDPAAMAYLDDNAGRIKKALSQADASVIAGYEQAIADLEERDPDRSKALSTKLLGKKAPPPKG